MRLIRGILWVLALLLVATAGFSGDFIRYHPPQFTVPTGQSLLLPNGSSSAPSLAFSSDPDSGFFWIGNTAFDWAVGGNSIGALKSTGISLKSSAQLGWTESSSPTADEDVILVRDAANTLALRNSTNNQTYSLYRSYTDASNYGAIDYTGTGIVDTYAGTGTAGFASIQGSAKPKALTESSATTVFTISLADKAVTSGHVTWAVHAADATNTQMVSNEFGFDCLNEADTEACTINNFGTDTDNTPTGTLTCTDAWSYGTNNASLTFNCVSSLTQTTLDAYVRLDMLVPQTVTFP